MPILAGFMVPHPPMIVPAVGRGSEKQVEKTTRAYEQVAEEIAALQPDTIIITSPHATMYADYFHISPGKSARGDFGQFRAKQESFQVDYDMELTALISALAREKGFPAGVMGERDKKLDHGTMVPLYFIRKAYPAVDAQMREQGGDSNATRQAGGQPPGSLRGKAPEPGRSSSGKREAIRRPAGMPVFRRRLPGRLPRRNPAAERSCLRDGVCSWNGCRSGKGWFSAEQGMWPCA